MKRIRGLLTGLAVGLLFCACGAGDEEVSYGGDPQQERAGEQAEEVPSVPHGDADAQTAASIGIGSCVDACTVVSSVNLTGNCCYCQGVSKNLRKSPFNPNVYLCM